MRWLWLLGLMLCTGCDDGASNAADPPDAQVADAMVDATPDAGPTCDDSQPPLVMAHGLLASGDTWAPHQKRFVANGHCADRYRAFDWNTLDMNADHVAALDAFIDALRAELSVDQVDLMGHSAGGGLGYGYLRDADRAAKVRRYVHVGARPEDRPAGPEGAAVETLNVWSPADLVVTGADIEGATNAEFENLDHYAVATDAAAFEAVYAFLYGEPPAVVDAPPQTPITLSGKAVVLGENTPEAGSTVEIWPVEPASGMRMGDAPAATLTVAEDGAFGPFTAQPDQPYEFYLQPNRDSPPVRYYREPFTRSDALVYLRTLPEPPGLAGILLQQVPFDDAHTVLVIFSASKAVLAGTDTLTVDGIPLATEALAAADDTTIAFFLYDLDTDQTSGDGAGVGLFAMFPFLSGTDLFIPADPQATSRIELNGRTLAVPRWSSGQEGAVIAVFD
jgi:pimeloyl-ACP methyl ester carboxylesterase